MASIVKISKEDLNPCKIINQPWSDDEKLELIDHKITTRLQNSSVGKILEGVYLNAYLKPIYVKKKGDIWLLSKLSKI